MELILPCIALVAGLLLLVWSADKFVDGASATAKFLGMSPLLIGMVVVGFGTSAPEMVVSAFSAIEGNPGSALGNAYGSNITNIALILGLTALIRPIVVQGSILRKELVTLAIITCLAAFLVYDGNITRLDAIILLVVFIGYMAYTILLAVKGRDNSIEPEFFEENDAEPISMKKALFLLVLGLAFLIISSRMVVYGATKIAYAFGVSDLIIGLTIVAVGTSLPELASSIAASKKGEQELVLGNILGSNLFNTLMVVGLAGVIEPMQVGREIFTRDISIMGALTLSLFLFGASFKKGRAGRINRLEGTFLVVCYVAYIGYLVYFSLGL